MEATRMNTPKLHELARGLGKGGGEVVMLIIKAMLVDFISFTGCEWSPAMIEGLLEQIKGNYGHLTMAQWKLFFVKAKSGQFAQEGQRDNQTMIARITPLMFCQWLLTFSAKCEEANEDYYASQQYEQKAQPKDEKVEYVPDEQVSEALLQFADKWQQEISEDKEAGRDEFRKQQVEGYAKLMNVNIDEVRKQFRKDENT